MMSDSAGVSTGNNARGPIWGEPMDAATVESLAARARRERKRRGWTQQEVADRTGVVSLGTVSNFERGVYAPQPAHLRAILRVLDLELESGDAQAEETRQSWPADVRVFLDVMGVFLTALPDERRAQMIHDLTRKVLSTP